MVEQKAHIQSLLESVQAVAPTLAEHSAEAEANRRLPRPVVDAMRDAGLYRIWRPKAFGGLEADPITGCKVFTELARTDAAAAWNVHLSNAVEMFGPWFPDEGAKEIFGNPEAILAGALNPPRMGVPVEGGLQLTGQTAFCSGVHDSRWVLGLSLILDGDAPRMGPNGQPAVLLTFCPTKSVEIVDTWRTLGMRGTGSHDVKMTNAFVADRWTAPLAPLQQPGSAYGGPLYRMTIWPLVAALSATSLGIAKAAVDELIALASGKTPSYTARTLRDRDVAQLRVAKASAIVGSAEAYLHQALQEGWEHAVAGNMLTTEHKTKIQLATSHAVDASAEAVDMVYSVAGASAFREEYRFQRCFRDVHTLTQHAFSSAARLESVGQLLFGLDSDWPFFGF